jgi:hypothetical protein
MMRLFCLALLLHFSFFSQGQESTIIKVHFLYGSKPKAQYKKEEQKWFGGVLGGHVGIEIRDGKILNFIPQGKFHWFAKNDNKHSAYALHSEESFYAILGGDGKQVKKTVVYIPINNVQKQMLDSIAASYLNQTPYDYALFGMRCGAATYEILGQLNILPAYSNSKTYRKIFYPKKLRKRLFKKASQHGWNIERTEGSMKRKWEKD